MRPWLDIFLFELIPHQPHQSDLKRQSNQLILNTNNIQELWVNYKIVIKKPQIDVVRLNYIESKHKHMRDVVLQDHFTSVRSVGTHLKQQDLSTLYITFSCHLHSKTCTCPKAVGLDHMENVGNIQTNISLILSIITNNPCKFSNCHISCRFKDCCVRANGFLPWNLAARV